MNVKSPCVLFVIQDCHLFSTEAVFSKIERDVERQSEKEQGASGDSIPLLEPSSDRE